MSQLGRIILGLGLSLAFAACGDGPTSPASLPTSVVKEDVRFQAAASVDAARKVALDVKLLNTSTASRYVTWGGCGIGIRLYRSGKLAYESPPVDAPCDAILHTAVIVPAQNFVATEFFYIDASLSQARYDVVLTFNGKIEGINVELKVNAGAVDL